MKKIKLEIEVEDDFEKGMCYSCPIAYCDANLDFEYFCPLCYTFETCPLEIEENNEENKN